MPEVFVGIGSNVEPERHIVKALHALARDFRALVVSPVYRNPAVGFEGDDFLNLAVGFETALSAAQLVAELHKLEQYCGRGRSEQRWGPRTLDLDLLLYGSETMDDPPVPRGDILKRAFVLRPLADIAPLHRHPGNGQAYADLWAGFQGPRDPMERVQLKEPDAVGLSKSTTVFASGNSDEKVS